MTRESTTRSSPAAVAALESIQGLCDRALHGSFAHALAADAVFNRRRLRTKAVIRTHARSPWLVTARSVLADDSRGVGFCWFCLFVQPPSKPYQGYSHFPKSLRAAF